MDAGFITILNVIRDFDRPEVVLSRKGCRNVRNLQFSFACNKLYAYDATTSEYIKRFMDN